MAIPKKQKRKPSTKWLKLTGQTPLAILTELNAHFHGTIYTFFFEKQKP